VNRIGISVKPNDPRACALLCELHKWLVERDCSVYVDHELKVCAGCSTGCDRLPVSEMPDKVQLMIVLGGDGTLLHAARDFIGSDTPILGINLGRLGFLTDTPVGHMFDVVEKILGGNLKTIRHFSLCAEVWRGDEMLATGSAMNDVVLERRGHPRMIGFEMYVHDRFVFRMRGDGLILATPAGSTAYALSAGGPIVHPAIDAITVVPVCPHTLSNRPVVVPADDQIELHLVESSTESAALNLDGIELIPLEQGDRVVVKKRGTVSLVYLPDRHYYEVLRTKLKWAGQVETG
jgi:NAD+ kinase